ncbi:MAG: hypothetical protein DI539_16530 [Flavobacterium psychrophilum]|jgi:hypothetical protein|nr:MAG: hypothetical protein DI539_16530 [Flavobacterium psychrophilum]
MKRQFLILIIAGITLSCSTKNGNEDGRLINHLGRTDTLTLYAQYSECGEWGGHQESLKIYRGNDDVLWTIYQSDTLNTCEGPIENNRIALAPRTIKLTEGNQQAIIRYMNDLLDHSLDAEMPSHSGEYFSIRLNDSELVTSRTVHGYKTFDKLINSVIK